MKIIEALNDMVIVDVLEDVEENITPGGIFIPDTVKGSKPQLYGCVLSVGPKVVSPIKPGDIIVFHAHGGQVIMFGGKALKILKEPEIYGKTVEVE